MWTQEQKFKYIITYQWLDVDVAFVFIIQAKKMFNKYSKYLPVMPCTRPFESTSIFIA